MYSGAQIGHHCVGNGPGNYLNQATNGQRHDDVIE